jgi:hypothetical protein
MINDGVVGGGGYVTAIPVVVVSYL